MTEKIGWDGLDESLQNYLQAESRDAMRALRDVGILQNRLTAEIALVKAMCNAVDWDTAEAKGVGIALHGGSGRPAEPDVKEPEEVPVRDFPCCECEQPVEEISPTYIVGAAYVSRTIKKWCPWAGGKFTTVQFRETGKLVCLGCGDNH